MAETVGGEVVIPIRFWDEEALTQFEQFRSSVARSSETVADEVEKAAQRRMQAELEVERRRLQSVEELEDRYAALRATNGDEYLASRMIALNRSYGRELALVGDREDLKQQIIENHRKQTLALEQEIMGRQLALGERATRESARAVTATAKTSEGGIFALKQGMGKAREATMFFTSSLSEFGETGRRVQGVVSGVAGAFLGGGPLLLGLELARVAVGALVDAWEEEERAAKAAAEAAEKEAQKATEAWLGRVGATRSWLDSLRDQRDQLKGVDAGWRALTALIAQRDAETNSARRGAIAMRVEEARAILMEIDALKGKAKAEEDEKGRTEARKRAAA
jgi:hypothetical protein